MLNLSANNKNTQNRLVTLGAVLVALVAVLILLYLLRGNPQSLLPDENKPDEISANYSELLLQQSPNDDSLRLKLIDLYLNLGRFDDAQQHWQQLHQIDSYLKEYYQFKIAAQTALALDKTAQYETLKAQLPAIQYQKLPTRQQEQLANLALQLEAPHVAADVYLHLAELAEGKQQITYYDRAARLYFASHQHHQSAAIHKLLANRTKGKQQIGYQQQVVADYLAGDTPETAVSYLRKLTESSKQALTNEQLNAAMNIALLAEDIPQAQYFNNLLLTLEPNNLEARQAQIQLNLANEDIEQAWQLRHWLLEHQPNDIPLLIEMAKLGEWNNDFAEALTLWMQALELEHHSEHFAHAWRLALQIFDFDRALQLLQPMSQERQLTDIEIGAVFYAHESRGTPEKAEQWLRNYIEVYPQHRLAWGYLQQNLENTEQYDKEIAFWSVMAEHFQLTTKEYSRWTEVHLFTYDTEGAWDVLNSNPNLDSNNIDYLRLLASVAWNIEDDAEMLLALQQLHNSDTTLYRDEISQLINLLADTDPALTIELSLDRWKQSHQLQDLAALVYVAQDFKDWELLQRIVDDTKNTPYAQSKPIFLARGNLALHQQDYPAAEAIFQQAINLYPQETTFHEPLLWLYVTTNQRDSIKLLLSQWQELAYHDSRLWLPFAASNQLLNRSKESLMWYQRYLELAPTDWLTQAAFADTLESAEYYEAAMRLRHQLLDSPQLNIVNEENYRTWLYLLTANYGQKKANAQALTWQDGSTSMLQLWFEQQLMLLSQSQQEQQKSFWLAWAKEKELVINNFELIEEALRTMNLTQLQRLLATQHLPVEQQVMATKASGYRHQAGALALSELGSGHNAANQTQLRNHALEELNAYPQGIQIGWQQRNFGGVTYSGPKVSIAKVLNDRWYARLNADQGKINIKNNLGATLANEKYTELSLNRQFIDGDLNLNINHSGSDVLSRTGASIDRSWQISPNANITLGYDWRNRSEASGLMYGLGQESKLWLSGSQQITMRDTINWGIEKIDYETRNNKNIANGKAFELQLAHSIFLERPTWIIKAGFDYQSNKLQDAILYGLPVNLEDNQPYRVNNFLSEEYKYAYLGTSLQRGEPGVLNRTTAQYTWLFDSVIGQQWPNNKITYSINTGIGVSVFGDDELALTVDYQSAPQNQFTSQSGTTLGISYSLRFGR